MQVLYLTTWRWLSEHSPTVIDKRRADRGTAIIKGCLHLLANWHELHGAKLGWDGGHCE